MVIEGRHLYTSIVPRMEKDRLSVQADPDEIETSDLDTPGRAKGASEWGSPSKPQPEKSSDNGPDREYFTPSGVKLKIIELPV